MWYRVLVSLVVVMVGCGWAGVAEGQVTPGVNDTLRCRADFSGNGVIDFADFLVFGRLFGQETPSRLACDFMRTVYVTRVETMRVVVRDTVFVSRVDTVTVLPPGVREFNVGYGVAYGCSGDGARSTTETVGLVAYTIGEKNISEEVCQQRAELRDVVRRSWCSMWSLWNVDNENFPLGAERGDENYSAVIDLDNDGVISLDDFTSFFNSAPTELRNVISDYRRDGDVGRLANRVREVCGG